MNASLLLCGLLLAQPAAEPPVVARPVDWSGLVGGPYVVRLTAEPKQLAAEDQLTLTVWIDFGDVANAGNLRDLKRPALAKLDTFRAFAIEDLDDNYAENPPRRWFRYLLRPRSDVKEIPRFKLVYFNPRAGRYQTTYSEPVPLTVRARAAPAAAVEMPSWIMAEWMAEEHEFFEFYCRLTAPSPWSFHHWWNQLAASIGASASPYYARIDSRDGGSYLVIAWVAPPLVGAAWYAIWRRRNPGAARSAIIHRSRAAAVALRILARADDDAPRQVRQAVAGYLQARAGLPRSASTSYEVLAYLRGSPSTFADPDEVAFLLRRCDDARFAPVQADGPGLVTAAASLIHKWDAQS